MKAIKHLSLTLILSGLIFFKLTAQIIAPALSPNSGSVTGLPDRFGRPAPDSRGWTDPALNHNKLLQQQTSEGFYKLIGPYKVVGTQFLFGEHHKGDMFSSEAKAYNVFLSYNTYNQEVEFYSTSNPNTPLVRETGTLDSFNIHGNPELGFVKNMKFIYGSFLGTKEKFYYLEVCKGDKYSLYKRYKSDLGYVSTNLAQSELRQFDLEYEYFYFEEGKDGLKKIKANPSSVIKEFKNIIDVSGVINNDNFAVNPEATLCNVFESLNQAKKGF